MEKSLFLFENMEKSKQQQGIIGMHQM